MSSEPFIMFINVRVLRLRSTDWKSSLKAVLQKDIPYTSDYTASLRNGDHILEFPTFVFFA